MRDLLTDVRYGFRNFRQSPGFFTLIVGILALGIAASVSIFSLVDGVLLRPLPYRDPQQLVTLTSYATKPPFSSNGSMSYEDFRNLKARSRSFSDLAVTFRTGWSRVTLTGGMEPQLSQGAFVSQNFFSLFGRAPILGRTFSDEENLRGERVVVISEGLWARRFGSSPNALGQNISINNARWRVIGVMPADFQVPFLNTQLWAPVMAHPAWNDSKELNRHEDPFWDVFARLNPDSSMEAAQAEVNGMWNGLKAGVPEDRRSDDLRVVPLREHFAGNVRKPMFILFAAVAFLLLIACANVGNLLLARAARRDREIAIRTALGAASSRLLRQLLTEALLLAFIAAAVGSAAAFALVPALKAVSPANTPLLSSVTLNGRGLALASLLSLALGTLLGLTAASRISFGNLPASLGAAGRSLTDSPKSRRMKSLLVVFEFALAMVLLTGAGLLIRSFIAVLNVDPGFRPQSILTVQMNLAGDAPAAQTPVLYRELMRRIAALPGVLSVGGTASLFYLDESRNHALRIVEGRPPEPKELWQPLVWTRIGGDYFQTMGIPLLRGRFFNDHDDLRFAPVAIVNETLARRYWPHENPIGKRLKGFDPRGRNDDWLTVVGVVGDTRAGGIEKAPFSQIYEVQAQRTEQLGYLVVRTSGNEAGLPNALRTLIHRASPSMVISSISSMEMLLDQQQVQRRFQTWLISIFSALALGLAALGVFGVMHYSVAARTNEIGIRMAVGAQGSDILRLVLADGTVLAMSGVAFGALAAAWLTKVIAGMLFGVGSGDPISFAGAALLLLLVSGLATYLPAHRASRIDPMMALRQE